MANSKNSMVGYAKTQVLHLVPNTREKKPERKRKNLIRLGI